MNLKTYSAMEISGGKYWPWVVAIEIQNCHQWLQIETVRVGDSWVIQDAIRMAESTLESWER
jgi:hypothetical protein